MSNEVVEKGLSRLAYQFKDSIKFKGFLEAFLQEYQELDVSGLQLLNERYLDSAEGVQLDGIGEIVGLGRPLKDVDVAGLFGFLLDTTSIGFGTFVDLDLGGNFWDGTITQVLIGDDLYRLLIRAKIIENQTAMVVDDTLRLVSFTFGNVEVRYFLVINLQPRYDIGKILDQFEESLLDDLPILIGLGDITYHSYAEDAFSFLGDISGSGFTDLFDTDLGGQFSKILT